MIRSYRVLLLLIVLIAIALVITGCGGTTGDENAADSGTIKYMSFQISESSIVGEMVKLLVENETNIEVELLPNVAGVTLAHEATQQGEADIYITYTGTQFSTVLGNDITEEWTDRVKIREFVEEEVNKQFGMVLLDNLGFDNTYAISINNEFAQEHNLVTIEDLQPFAPEMVIAADYDFLNREGAVSFTNFAAVYDLDFKEAIGMDLGLIYQAAEVGDVDAIVSWSSDGRIAYIDLFTLEDSKNVFPPYDAALIIRQETLDTYPGLEAILNKLGGLFDVSTIQRLNMLVDVEEQAPEDVAEEFLREKGLL